MRKRKKNPMRPTTKDLAEAAGVSLATVDRVLNDRPNVSKKARTRVHDAIDRIGFVRNFAAVSLARGRQHRYRFVLPTAGDQYMNEILVRIDQAADALRGDAVGIDVVRVDTSDPHLLANYLASIETGEISGLAVMTPETPPVRDAILRLQERGGYVVEFLSGRKENVDLDFVGIDNFAAGATAARLLGRFHQESTGSIMVISETMHGLDSIQRRFGFDNVINANFPHLRCLPTLETYNGLERAKTIIENQFRTYPDITAIYCMSSEARLPIEIANNIRDLSDLNVIVHERTPFTENALKAGSVDAVIGQNPGHAVRSAIRVLRALSEGRDGQKEQDKIRIEILLAENL